MNKLPYPGLRPFHRDEADIFFGRRELVIQLLDKLNTRRFLAVVGLSGCGKSSLVQAGMLNGLEAGFIPKAGPIWRIAQLRPRRNPMKELTQALFKALEPERGTQPDSAAFLRATLDRGPLGLVEVLDEEPRLPEDTNLLILVDQFEEVFRYRQYHSRDEAEAFVALLLESAKERQGKTPVYVVITMRSEFLGDCALFRGLPEALNESLFLIPRLTREQRREAIERPAQVFGGKVEPDLVNQLLNDIEQLLNDTVINPDPLPLLQHALMRLWKKASPQKPLILTLEDYRDKDIGGLENALSTHADEAYNELKDEKEKAIAETLFRCLSERIPGRGDIRHPVPLEEVVKVAGVEQEQIVKAIVDTFRRPEHSFLTLTDEPLTSKTIIDISHESLIRHWQRLKEWVDKEAESASVYRRLLDGAHLNKQGKAGLWGKQDLDYARLVWQKDKQPTSAWAERYGNDYELVMNFFKTSEAIYNLARSKSLAFESNRLPITSNEKVPDQTFENLPLKLLLAFESLNTQSDIPDPTAESALRRALLNFGGFCLYGYRGQISTLAISFNNRWLAAGGEDRTIRLWDMHNPSAVPKTLKGHGGWVNVIVISPDNRWLVSGSDDGTVRLWDLDALHRKLEPLHGEGHIRAMVIGPPTEAGNYWLAVGSDNSNVRLWAFRSQSYSETPILLRTQAWGTKALAISPKTGRWLVSGHDTGTAFLWDLTKLDLANKPDPIDKPTDILVGHTNTIRSVAISADDRWLITGSNDYTARIWRLAEQTSFGQPTTLYGHQREISVVAISPDSRWAVTGSGDRTARLWSLPAPDSGYEPQFAKELTGHKNWISALAISADSRWLVTTSGDGTARRWDLTDRDAPPLEMRGHGGQIRTAAIGGVDNRRLFTGGDDETVHIRDLAGLEDTYPIVLLGRKDNNSEVWTTGISPDNKWLATGHRDGKVRLWKLTEKGVSGDPWILNPKAWGTCTIAFINKNNDDKWLITGHDEGAIYLWDLESLETRNPDFELDFKPSYLLRGHKKSPGEGTILAIAVSPDGHWLITRSKDATARLWDLSKLKSITSPETIEVESTKVYEYTYPAPNPAPNPVRSVAISPKGNWLAIGIEGGMVYLSELTEEGATDRFTLKPQAWGVYTMDISTENNKDKWLITGHADGTIRLWDLEQFATKDPNNGTELQPTFVLQGYSKDFIGERDIQSLAVSGNGHWLVTGSKDKTFCLCDLSALSSAKQPIPISILRGHEDAIKAVAISPDCYRVVTGSADGTVRLWNLTDLNQSTQPEDIDLGDNYASNVKALTVSPDSRWLVTGCADGTAHLWNLRLDDQRRLACQVVGRNFTQAEWDKYFPKQEYQQTCSELPPHHSVIEHKLEQATSDIQRGDREAARTAYQQAVKWAVKTDDASLNGAIGRHGSLNGFAEIVKSACERAVELEPDDSAYRDTRALARALTGDYDGAIEDLKFHETQPEAYFEKDLLKKRHGWIKKLQKKQNPFDGEIENFKKQLASEEPPIRGIHSLLGAWVKE